MHSLIGVILPFKYDGDKLHEAIGTILSPWNENDESVKDGQWDWWQLGGRWTGVWSDYNPLTDPANWEACWLCHGTGRRDDPIASRHRETVDPAYACNGCGYGQGPKPGIAVKYATQWVIRPDKDVIAVPALVALLAQPEPAQPSAIVAAPDHWVADQTWNGKDFDVDPDWAGTLDRTLTKYRDCWVTAVDIHS